MKFCLLTVLLTLLTLPSYAAAEENTEENDKEKQVIELRTYTVLDAAGEKNWTRILSRR